MYEEQFGNNKILAMNRRLSELDADSDETLSICLNSYRVRFAASESRERKIEEILRYEFNTSAHFTARFMKMARPSSCSDLQQLQRRYKKTLSALAKNILVEDYELTQQVDDYLDDPYLEMGPYLVTGKEGSWKIQGYDVVESVATAGQVVDRLVAFVVDDVLNPPEDE